MIQMGQKLGLLLFLLLAINLDSFGEITVLDNEGVDEGSGTLSSTETVHASSDLLIFTFNIDDNDSIHSCTWNGNTIAVADADSYPGGASGGYAESAIFSWDSPDTGAHTASCAVTGYLSWGVIRRISVSGTKASPLEDEFSGESNAGYGTTGTLSPYTTNSISVTTCGSDRAQTISYPSGSTTIASTGSQDGAVYELNDAAVGCSKGISSPYSVACAGYAPAAAAEANKSQLIVNIT